MEDCVQRSNDSVAVRINESDTELFFTHFYRGEPQLNDSEDQRMGRRNPSGVDSVNSYTKGG